MFSGATMKIRGVFALALGVALAGSAALALDFNDVKNLLNNQVPESVVINMATQDPVLAITTEQANELRAMGASETLVSSIRRIVSSESYPSGEYYSSGTVQTQPTYSQPQTSYVQPQASYVQPQTVYAQPQGSATTTYVSPEATTYYSSTPTYVTPGTTYVPAPVVVSPAPTVIYETAPTYVVPGYSYPRSSWGFSIGYGSGYRYGPRYHGRPHRYPYRRR